MIDQPTLFQIGVRVSALGRAHTLNEARWISKTPLRSDVVGNMIESRCFTYLHLGLGTYSLMVVGRVV